MAWIYLVLAATCETCWTFCLKLMKWDDLKTLRFTNFYKWEHGGLPILLPLIGYLLFGLANIYLFSLAMKHIPVATAFAVWTAVTLIFIKIAEVSFFHSRISLIEVFSMALIMAGIFGLRYASMQVK